MHSLVNEREIPHAHLCSACTPLFLEAYNQRGAGAVIHSHSLNAVLATLLDPSSSEFVVTELEMIKGGCLVWTSK